jgi:hypothetical protein
LFSITWAADGRSRLVAGKTPEAESALLRVPLDGKALVLVHSSNSEILGAIPSPDGRSLAITEKNVYNNLANGKFLTVRFSAAQTVWRRERDSNPRYRFRHSGFQDRPFQPLTHPSVSEDSMRNIAFPGFALRPRPLLMYKT